ncbi:mucin-2-like isoform X1 [Ostrea edulis]|uniref:mucin-2-like isoform X1 n=2 Tax=Ostrea edulis TaxID=37623 RepID=UPI0024AEF554|nr:mucin-2-like isoform X1 [Ostrea edulis]
MDILDVVCLLVFNCLAVTRTGSQSLYFCNTNGIDPCEVANSREPFEPEARFVNCDYSTYSSLCDRYITPGWYRYKSNMLDRCPSLLNCGALYPNWLNGSHPASVNTEVVGTACKVGFSSCCDSQVTIKIRHCGLYMAYCLPALDSCPTRYCFGETGECNAASESVSSTTFVQSTTLSQFTKTSTQRTTFPQFSISETTRNTDQSTSLIQSNLSTEGQSASSTQPTSSRDQSTTSTQSTISTYKSTTSTQPASNTDQSTTSTQLTSNTDQSTTSSKQPTISTIKSTTSTHSSTSTGQSTQPLTSTRGQSTISTQPTSGTNQSTSAQPTFSTGGQSTTSTQPTVGTGGQSATSTQLTSSTDQSTTSTQSTVGTGDQSATSTQFTSSTDQSATSTQLPSSTDQSTTSTQSTVGTGVQSTTSTQFTSNTDKSTTLTQSISNTDQSTTSTQPISNTDQSTTSTQSTIGTDKSTTSTHSSTGTSQATTSTQPFTSTGGQSIISTQTQPTISTNSQLATSTQPTSRIEKSTTTTYSTISTGQSIISTQTITGTGGQSNTSTQISISSSASGKWTSSAAKFLTTTPSLNEQCLQDPCDPRYMENIPNLVNRSNECIYDSTLRPCDLEIKSVWYTGFHLLNKCPDFLRCGAVYPVWMNGSEPAVTDGIVTRQACKVAPNECCAEKFEIKVVNCSLFTAYCLTPLRRCEERYCFDTKTCSTKPKKQETSIDGDAWSTLYFIIPIVAIIIIMIIILWYIKRRRKQTDETYEIPTTTPSEPENPYQMAVFSDVNHGNIYDEIQTSQRDTDDQTVVNEEHYVTV